MKHIFHDDFGYRTNKVPQEMYLQNCTKGGEFHVNTQIQNS